MNKHTPGPWHLGLTNDYGYPSTVRALNVSVAAPAGPWDAETHAANARLIAAAPELLESCKEMIEWIGDGPDPWVNEAARAVLRIAKDAIAKATGEDAK